MRNLSVLLPKKITITNDQLVDGKIPDELLRLITDDVTELDLSHCSRLTELPRLPQGLQKLNLHGCSNLTTLPALPQSLKWFILLNCTNLTTLPALPQSLEWLYIHDCTKLTTLPDLPTSLQKLNLHGCSNLTTLPDLPTSLQELYLHDCTNLTTLPTSLQKIYLDGCPNLTTLPALPTSLQYLNLKNCSNLTTLPALPTSLQKLYLLNCTNLTTLPDLPTSLNHLDLTGCNNLSIESIAKLEALEEANQNNPDFTLIWPENLSQNSVAIDPLKEAYKKFYSSNPVLAQREPDVTDQLNYPTLALLHRFTSESLGIRGKKEVIAQARLLSEEIQKNPEILEILDKKSTHYLKACINQPVSGFAEISAIMEIAKQDDITAKIEKAKILRAQQLIKYNIRDLRNADGNLVSSHVEVELGNAMLSIIHEKLLADKTIKQKWPGIPDNIAYVQIISSFLTADNIDKTSNKVKKVLLDTAKSKKDVIDFLCEVETDFWAKLILTKEQREKTKHETPEEKKQQEAHLIAQQKRIEELREEIIDLDLSQTALISQKNKELQEIEKDIENKRLTNLSDLLKQKTQELLTQKPLPLQRLAFAKPMEVISTTTSETYFKKSQKNKEGNGLTDLTYQGRRYEPAGGVFYDRSLESDFGNNHNEDFLTRRNILGSLQRKKSLYDMRSQINLSSLPATPENEIISSLGSQNSEPINPDIDNQPSELINPVSNDQPLHSTSLSSQAESQRQSPDGVSADLVFIEEFSKQDQSKSSPLTRVSTRQTATKIESLTADFVYLPKK
ncbi:MAG: hypothetical protein RL769_739 [Pseudomonadota bacterium]